MPFKRLRGTGAGNAVNLFTPKGRTLYPATKAAKEMLIFRAAA